MYREDLYYADSKFLTWSTNLEGPGKEKFEKFSPRFKRLYYPKYILDDRMRIRACQDTRVVNLEELVSVLRSKDARLLKQIDWVF